MNPEIPVRKTGEIVVGTGEEVIDWVRWGDISDNFNQALNEPPKPPQSEPDFEKFDLQIFKGVISGLIKGEENKLNSDDYPMRDYTTTSMLGGSGIIADTLAQNNHADMMQEIKDYKEIQADAMELTQMANEVAWGKSGNYWSGTTN